MTNSFKVRYIGEDAAEIRNGEVYEAKKPTDWKTMYAVRDRSLEWYLYPRELFEIIENRNETNR